MKKISIIIPNLNESYAILEKNIKICKEFLDNNNGGEVIVADGGSSYIKNLSQLCNNYSTVLVKVSCVLDFPIIYPNKNIGLLNSLVNISSDITFVIDSDWGSLDVCSLEYLNEFINKNNCEIVLPDANLMSGRINRLVGNPILRLFFPEIASKVGFPFPGLYIFNTKLLKQITRSKDYFLDWGGELQIVVEGFLNSSGKVLTPLFKKEDAKHRSMESKYKDAIQIYRTAFYLAHKHGRLKCKDINKLVQKDINNNKRDVDELRSFLLRNKITLVKDNDPYEYYKSLQVLASKNPEEIARHILEIFKESGVYEFLEIYFLVVKVLIELILNKEISLNKGPVKVDSIQDKKLKKVSIICDLIIAAIISTSEEKNISKFEHFSSSLSCVSTKNTEFTDIELTKYIQGKELGIDLESLTKDDISKLRDIINKSSNPVFRNNKILEIIK